MCCEGREAEELLTRRPEPSRLFVGDTTVWETSSTLQQFSVIRPTPHFPTNTTSTLAATKQRLFYRMFTTLSQVSIRTNSIAALVKLPRVAWCRQE